MVNSIFPVIVTSDLDESSMFYRDLLGIEVVFESGWYSLLQHADRPSLQIGFVSSGHETVPESLGRVARGVLVSVEVDDVDVVHDRAVGMHAEIVWPLADERFGQRHFMVADPAGLIVDVITPIAPSRGFLREVARWRRANR